MLFSKTLKSFSIKTLSILSISEIVPVALNGLTIQLLTKRLNSLTILQSSHINCLGIIARRKKAIWSLLNIKWHFKHQTTKKIIFLIFSMIIIYLLSPLIWKVELSSNFSITLTFYMWEQLELPQIMSP